MKLQEIIKGKIEEFGGSSLFIDNLENISYRVSSGDRFWINMLMIQISGILNTEIRIIEHTLECKRLYQETINILKNVDENQKDKTIIFTIELLEYQLDYVKGVSLMAC